MLLGAALVAEGGVDTAGLGGGQRSGGGEDGLLRGDAEETEGVVGVSEVDRLVGYAGDDLDPAVRLAGFGGGIDAVGPVPLGGGVPAAVVADPSRECGQISGRAKSRAFKEVGTPSWMRRATSASWATIAERYKPPPLAASALVKKAVTFCSAVVVSVSKPLAAWLSRRAVPPSIRSAARMSGVPRASLKVSRRLRARSIWVHPARVWAAASVSSGIWMLSSVGPWAVSPRSP
ncbi:hypothetical protein [Streptomyces sp. PSAA01]|uniref:hypothetical protein n=1 Tax=Streptomyces sp. PSAA01 TaxID=2912762 RepID=UPI001F3B0AF1|nr:hypothetical protein [Streptomyces sp. PSAA01]MCG0284105.1 hypothetical protein [Streptomyces sp. PSAA01]